MAALHDQDRLLLLRVPHPASSLHESACMSWDTSEQAYPSSSLLWAWCSLGWTPKCDPDDLLLTSDTICGEPRLVAAARRVYIGRSLRQHGGGSYRRTSGGEDTLFFARHWG